MARASSRAALQPMTNKPYAAVSALNQVKFLYLNVKS